MDKAIWTDSTPEQKTILMTILMMANHDEKQWLWNGEKYTCQPGQFITSIESLTRKSGKGISKQNVRTALVKFEKLDFLTNQSTKTGRLITIVNWGKYQLQDAGTNIPTNKDLTKHSQSTNKALTPNKKERMKEGENKGIVLQPDVCEVVDYLNTKLGTNYRPTTRKIIDLIKARLNEGATVDDFRVVIDKKYDEWHNDPKMAKFLRPDTLFGTKFDGYLNQPVVKNKIVNKFQNFPSRSETEREEQIKELRERGIL